MLARRPLGHRIADQLRAEILSGEIQDGHRLTQEAICARFSTSRIPVRDAVQILSYEGLVVATSSGIIVTAPTNTDLEDMLRIESALHVLATRLASKRASEEDLQKLKASQEEAMKVVAVQDHFSGFTVNYNFHRVINRLAESPRLLAALRANSVRMQWPSIVTDSRHVPGTISDHDEIVDAMLARQEDRAAELMSEHMARINEGLIRQRLELDATGK